MTALDLRGCNWLTASLEDWLAQLQDTLEIDHLQRRYRAAVPFPHLVVDDLFPAGLLDAIEASFAELQAADLIVANQALHRKTGTAANVNLPAGAQRYFNLVYSGPFLRFLTRITGIENLIPDPSLFGGGMHEIRTGGRFDVHTDFRKHPHNGLDNRLVLITYLNRGWQEAYGGAFELWRQNPAERVASFLPEFGRTLLIHQSSLSAHGHPMPVATPDGRTRRSVAAYFYTNGRDDNDIEPGPGSRYSPRITQYIKRPGRTFGQKFELLVREVVPPIVLTGMRAVNRKLFGA
jgi:hypothetical protein